MIRRVLIAGLLISACGGNDPRLVESSQIAGDTIPQLLTETPGDANRGKIVFSERDQGHCVLCHVVQGLDAEFQGNVGPDLTYVADRLSAGQIRLRIVDYQLVRPGTLMPSYYRNHDLYQVGEAFADAPILTAEQIEDLVAYLIEMKADEDE